MKIIKISSCSECPHEYGSSAYTKRFCGILTNTSENYDTDISEHIKNQTLPKWCGLEDEGESK